MSKAQSENLDVEFSAPGTEQPTTVHALNSDDWSVSPQADGTYDIVNRVGDTICHGFRDVTIARHVAEMGRTLCNGLHDRKPKHKQDC